MSADTAELNPLDRPVWGLESIAREANRTVKQTSYMIEQGLLDVTRLKSSSSGSSGRHCRLVTTARRVRRSLGIND
jgi:hypothetical protein